MKDGTDPTHAFDGQRRLREIGKNEQLLVPNRPSGRLGAITRFAIGIIQLAEPEIPAGLRDPPLPTEMPPRRRTTAITGVADYRGQLGQTSKRVVIAHESQ